MPPFCCKSKVIKCCSTSMMKHHQTFKHSLSQSITAICIQNIPNISRISKGYVLYAQDSAEAKTPNQNSWCKL